MSMTYTPPYIHWKAKSCLLIFLCIFLPCNADARDRLRIVGSSTVYPFSSVAAEIFGRQGDFKTPVVEATGTGAGFKLFCSGFGAHTPDIANASRPVKASELELCRANNVTSIMELKIGYDGIVIASAGSGRKMDFTTRDIFLAMAREVPHQGSLTPNFYKKWNEINPALPDMDIVIYGPPPTSGTRDAFTELLMEKTCAKFPEFAKVYFAKVYKDEKERKLKCQLLREDGAFVEVGENNNITIQKLKSNPGSFGIFGYSYFEENQDTLQASAIDGTAPEPENITSGLYPISRSLFIYFKLAHVGLIPGMTEFAAELTSGGAIGESGYLTNIGLIPLSREDIKQTQETAASMKENVILLP